MAETGPGEKLLPVLRSVLGLMGARLRGLLIERELA